jgi:hypothetical protein
VKVKGSFQNDFYTKHDSQLMCNPRLQLEANKARLNQGHDLKPKLMKCSSTAGDTQGKLASSKRIKKNKKHKKTQNSKSNYEEEEEGLLSDQENMSDNSGDQFESPKTLLVDKYQRFPEWIEISVDQNQNFLEFMGPFNSANKYEIEHVLSSETKHYVSSTALPLLIRVFLVPELNVLTVEC